MYVKNKFCTVTYPISAATTKDIKFNKKQILRNTFKNKPVKTLFIKNKNTGIYGPVICVEKKGKVKANLKGRLRPRPGIFL